MAQVQTAVVIQMGRGQAHSLLCLLSSASYSHRVTLNVTPKEMTEAELEATSLLPAEPRMTTPHTNDVNRTFIPLGQL